MNKKFLILVVFLIVILPLISADGVIWDPDMNLITEHSQLALVDWKDGKQSMLLSIEIDELHGKNAIWIFPVPALPQQTVIGILPEFPDLRGVDLEKQAKENIATIMQAARASQIYPIFLQAHRVYYPLAAGNLKEVAGAFEAYKDVVVYEHIEKEGIVTELITTSSWEGLYQYLGMLGLAVSREKMSVLEHYIGKDYSFIVSWLSKVEKTERQEDQLEQEKRGYYPYYIRRPGVIVNFPTEKPYFPLIPTSAYGSQIVTAHVYLLGLWSVDSYPDINPYVSHDYYYDYYKNSRFDEEAKIFFSPQRVYTKVDINSPSKLFSEDLYFSEQAPVSKYIALSILEISRNNTNRRIIIFIFIALLSLAAGSVAGKIIFKEGRKFALHGLWNLLSIIGLIVAIIFVRTKEISNELKKALLKEKVAVSIRDLRKIWFILLFTALFILFSWILQSLLISIF